MQGCTDLVEEFGAVGACQMEDLFNSFLDLFVCLHFVLLCYFLSEPFLFFDQLIFRPKRLYQIELLLSERCCMIECLNCFCDWSQLLEILANLGIVLVFVSCVWCVGSCCDSCVHHAVM